MLSLDAKQTAVRWPSRQHDTYRAIPENLELDADESVELGFHQDGATPQTLCESVGCL